MFKFHSTVSIGTSGYLYVYCSNESNTDVFFDNLQLFHTRGPLLEANNYYPFGLTMAGISDKAIKTNYTENKYRFNKGSELQNKEFSDGSGLDWYDAMHRMYDPQIGRFGQIDPIAPILEDWSPYTFCFDNPTSMSDESGLAADSASSVPAHRQHKPKTKSLNPVIVRGTKKTNSAKTPPVVHAPAPMPKPKPVVPPMQPPAPLKDKVLGGLEDLNKKAYEKIEGYKNAIEAANQTADLVERIANLNNKVQIGEWAKIIGKPLTVLNAYDKVNEGDYFGAALDGLSFIPKANPYVFSYQVVSGVWNSDFMLSGAYLDAYETMENYMKMTHNDWLDNDYEQAQKDWGEVIKYAKIADKILAQLREKKAKK